MCVCVCEAVIMQYKGLVVQSETVGFEVRWEMLFCLAEQTQCPHSACPLTAHCPPTTTGPPHTRLQGEFIAIGVEACRRKSDGAEGQGGGWLLEKSR